MTYYIEDEEANQLFRGGTLAEAREAVIGLINKTEFTRQELASKNVVPTRDEDGGILKEQYIFTYEDIDRRVMFAIIKHDSVT